jgi:hypothetical protein
VVPAQAVISDKETAMTVRPNQPGRDRAPASIRADIAVGDDFI